MRRLTLDEIRAIERQQGVVSFTPRIVGHVQAIKRDIDSGEVTGGIAEHNLITNAAMDWWCQDYDRRLDQSRYVFISNETEPTDTWKNIYFNTYQNASKLVATASINTTSLYWTYQVTFTAPTAPGRTIRNIGLCHESDDTVYLNARMGMTAFAVARLTSDLFQSNTESLEVVYRLTFQQVL